MTISSIQFGYGARDAKPQYDGIKATQFFFASLLAYLIAAWAVKNSVALVLYRLASADMRAVKRILETSMGLFTLLTIVAIFMVAFQCRPLSVIWGVGEGTCLPPESLSRIGLVFGAIDIVLNFLYSVSVPPQATRAPSLAVSSCTDCSLSEPVLAYPHALGLAARLPHQGGSVLPPESGYSVSNPSYPGAMDSRVPSSSPY